VSGGLHIQSDFRGTVGILGGDGIGYCEKKSLCEHVSGSDWLPRERELYEYSDTEAL
jgi:hypothetical protein